MPIEFRCPHCGKLLRTPDASAGKKGKCPHCQGINDIPLASTAAAATPDKPVEPVATPRPLPRERSSTSPSSPAGPTPTSPAASNPPAPTDLFANLPSAAPTQGPGQVDLFAGAGPVPTDLLGGGPGFDAPQAGYSDPLKPMPGANPYGDAPNPYSAPSYAASQPTYGYGYQNSNLEPHRAGLVLTLGIVSLISGLFGLPGFCCCLFWPADIVSLAVGIPAAIFGHIDLQKMRNGVMDPSGQGSTMTGFIMGIVGVVLALLAVLGVVLNIIFRLGFTAMNMQNRNF